MGTHIMFTVRAGEIIVLISLGFILFSAKASKDYTKLVYRNCESSRFTDTSASFPYHTEALASLFAELVSRSSRSKFFRTTAGDDRGGISGFYQCSKILSNQDCHGCVSRLPDLSNTLCNGAMAAKIQLAGCFLRYEADSISEAKHSLPVGRIMYEEEHKYCSKEKTEIEGFDELRNLAFEELESEVVSRHGYCTVEREGFQAVAQCEEDMGECECGKCISAAVEIATGYCERAISGQVFLNQCSVKYMYGYDHGGDNGFGGGIGGNGGFPFPGFHEGEEHHPGRQLAIIVGGGAGALLIGFFLLAIIGCMRRKDDI